MRRGRSQVTVDLNKFLVMKKCVDEGLMLKKDACKELGISFYLYQKFASKLKE